MTSGPKGTGGECVTLPWGHLLFSDAHQHTVSFFFFFLSRLPHPVWGLNSRPGDQELHALPTEPARQASPRHDVLTEGAVERTVTLKGVFPHR